VNVRHALPLVTWSSTLAGLGIPTFLGVLLGWLLNRRSRDTELVKQQQREAAGLLLDALVEAELALRVMVPRADVHESIEQAQGTWRRAMLRYAGRIGNVELTSRVEGMLIVFTLARSGGIDDDHDLRSAPPSQHLIDITQIAGRAFLDSYVALEAFLNGQSLPPRSFPANPIEVMASGGQDGIATLWEAVRAMPEPEQTTRLKLITLQ
jgi:hypothetical protein